MNKSNPYTACHGVVGKGDNLSIQETYILCMCIPLVFFPFLVFFFFFFFPFSFFILVFLSYDKRRDTYICFPPTYHVGTILTTCPTGTEQSI